MSATTQLVAGVKNVNVSGDGTYFIGGSTAAGGHGLLVGVKTSSVPANGFYYGAGMRYDTQPARLAAVVGTVDLNTTALSGATWARRIRQSDGVFDAALLTPLTLNPDGTGVLATGGQAAFNSGPSRPAASMFEARPVMRFTLARACRRSLGPASF